MEGQGPYSEHFLFFINYKWAQRVFAPGKLFQLSLMCVGMARSLLENGKPKRCFTWISSSLTHKRCIWLEKPARNTHKLIGCVYKFRMYKCCEYGPQVWGLIHSSLVSPLFTNKLEFLSLASLSSLVLCNILSYFAHL